jgi:SAM-dependent methyltransferase
MSVNMARVRGERCWLCGARARVRPAAEGGFDRVACVSCGALFVSPMVSEAEARAIYEHETSWSLGSALDKGARLEGAVYEGRRASAHRRIGRELDRLTGGPGRLLDVGCGAGAFLQHMQRSGWRAEGIDINPQFVRICRERGLDVRLGSPSELADSGQRFDCVSFLNVIGYIPDPIATLQLARRVLRPGGVVVIEDPNLAFHQFPMKLFATLGRREMGLSVAPRPPRRLFVLEPRAYRRLFARAGLDPVQIAPCPARHEGAPWAAALRRLVAAAGEAVYAVSDERLLLTPSLLAFGRRGGSSVDGDERAGTAESAQGSGRR